MEYKHNQGDLRQMQSLPLESKIMMTKYRIRDWYNYYHGDVYTSFSGGKDSTVLKHIVDSMYDDVPAVYVNTGLEYPEIQRFVRKCKKGEFDCFNKDVEIIRPEMRFDKVIHEYGYPVVSKEIAVLLHEQRVAHEHGNYDNYVDRKFAGTYVSKNGKTGYSISRWKCMSDLSEPKRPFKVSHKCCDIMKKKPAHKYSKETGRMAIIGTMATESKVRTQIWMKYGCNAFELKHPNSNPLSFWTEQDIFEYILKYDVPYCSVYGGIVEDDEMPGQMFIDGYHGKLRTTGCDRTGCMFCLFGEHLNTGVGKFERMKISQPKQYEYCMKPVADGGLGLKDVIDWMNENANVNIKY